MAGVAAEFTGERVIPGQVELDLWNEHCSRYAFAARFVAGKRVLDLGCGAGYGSAMLARTAAAVIGMDRAHDALTYARSHYADAIYAGGLAEALPFADASFDAVVAFEVIEHLTAWRSMLSEAERVLRPEGRLLVSTPNKLYYSEARQTRGPNPFHAHEFEYEEFRSALETHFAGVNIYTQNHAGALVFCSPNSAAHVDAEVHRGAQDLQACHFFLAVCGASIDGAAREFVYVPESANVLRERELHIGKLQSELTTKDSWLAKLQQEHESLLRQYREQSAEMEKRNEWIMRLDERLAAAGERILALQAEAEAEREAAKAAMAGYESKIGELERDNQEKTNWALETEQRLTGEIEQHREQLRQTIELLDRAESTLEERTNWALSLQQKIEELERQLSMVRASRWMKAGRAIGLGPRLQEK